MHQSTEMMDDQVSEEFKSIVELHIFGCRPLPQRYKPSLVEIEYLAEYIKQKTDVTSLSLGKIILTAESGSHLGKLLNDSQIKTLFVEIRGDGDLAFIREMKQIEHYFFFGDLLKTDEVEILAYSLTKSLTTIDLSYTDITGEGLGIILRALKVKMKETKIFDYTMKWDTSLDISLLKLNELFDCIESYELRVHRFGNSTIKIDNLNHRYSRLSVDINYDDIESGFKEFLNQIKHRDWNVTIDETNRGCSLLLRMIYLIRDFTTTLSISCTTGAFIGRKKVIKIMNALENTRVVDLELYISDLTKDSFELIIHKLKNMNLNRLSFNKMEMNDFDSQAVVKLLQFPNLRCLAIYYCGLNDELVKQLFLELEYTNLDTFSICEIPFNNTLANIMSQSLIASNLTNIELACCNINCKQAEMIAESLKYTYIKYIDLSGNNIKNDGVKAIASVVKQSQLDKLMLDSNPFDENGAIELLKSIEKKNIIICGIDDCHLMLLLTS